MAVLLNNQNDDEQNQSQPLLGGGQSSTISSGGPIAPTSSGPSQQRSSGRFVNLQKYLQANKDFNKEGGGIAGRVTEKVQEKGQQTSQGIGQLSSGFQQQAQGGRIQYNAGLIGQAIADPTAATKDPGRFAAIKQQMSGQYGGPQNLQQVDGYQQSQQQVQNLQDIAQNSQAPGGRFNLLKQTFNRPTYSTGQTRLDSLLLNRGDKSQLQNLINTSQQVAQDQTQGLSSAEQQASQLASQYQQEAAGTAAQTEETFRTGINDFTGGLNRLVDQARAQQEAARAELAKRLNSGKFTNNDLAKLGIGAGESLYNIDPSDFIRVAQDPTVSTVATREDYAKANALLQLIGQGSGLARNLGDLADPRMAGTFNAANSLDVDWNAMKNAIEAQNRVYTSERAATEAEIARLEDPNNWNGVVSGGIEGKQSFLRRPEEEINKLKAHLAFLDQTYKPERKIGLM